MNFEVIGPLLLDQPLIAGQPAHLSAASGLVELEGWLHVIADDALQLTTFRFPDLDRGRMHKLLWDPPLPADEKERKKLKPDLESLTLVTYRDSPALLTVGSGSAENRRRGLIQPLYECGEVDGSPIVFDLTSLYEAFDFSRINIEGVAASGETLYLAQRGNSRNGFNALINLDLVGCLKAIDDGRAWGRELLREIKPVELGDLDGVSLTLTDIAPHDSQHLVFTAAAEATDDPYHDGAIVGSVLGLLNLQDGRKITHRLDGPWKVEGVCVLPDGRILMVTDNDDPSKPALLLEARGRLSSEADETDRP